eukprot:gene12485-16748_t
MACCPPNSEKYLAVSYAPIGKEISINDGYELYTAGNPTESVKQAILMIPDVFGWNGGRARNYADMYAEAGYFTVVPKLLQPALDGGTDGDGLPPTFDFATGQFAPYITQITWEGVIRPRIVATIDYLKANGIEKAGINGMCWGGWVALKIFSDPELEGFFTCACVPHPSFQLEGFFGGTDVSLASKVSKPLLLLPALGDSENLNSNGELFLALKANNSLCETTDETFRHLNHGFYLRAPSGPSTDEFLNLSMAKVIAFIAQFN